MVLLATIVTTSLSTSLLRDRLAMLWPALLVATHDSIKCKAGAFRILKDRLDISLLATSILLLLVEAVALLLVGVLIAGEVALHGLSAIFSRLNLLSLV